MAHHRQTENRDKMYDLGARLFTIHTGGPAELVSPCAGQSSVLLR
ncbi:hypothetical protein AB0F81_44890 [Actinoplanes sp. NPDC024001]